MEYVIAQHSNDLTADLIFLLLHKTIFQLQSAYIEYLYSQVFIRLELSSSVSCGGGLLKLKGNTFALSVK